MLGCKVRKWGNSLGIILPKDMTNAEGVREGDVVYIQVRKQKIDGFGILKGGPHFEREDDEHGDLY